MQVATGRQLARLLGEWSAQNHAGPAYVRLAAAIRLLVLDGRLALATRLPGERELALALGLSRTTITSAYDALRTAGYAASKRGAGTWTALPDAPGRPAGTSGRSADSRPVDGQPAGAAEPAVALMSEAADGDHLDLAHAAPEAPAQVLRDAFDVALCQLTRYLPGSGYSVLGLPDLRAAVAARYDARGLPTSPDQILITSGAQHAFSLVLSLVSGPGDRLLVEHPTYHNALDAARRAGARLVPVAPTSSGWDLDALSAAVRQTGPRLAYLVPDFGNPTGLLIGNDQRVAAATELARSRTLTVIDESLVEIAFDGDLPAPFAAHAPERLVITIGSTSKILWGGLRVGWIRADAGLVRRLGAARAIGDIASPVLEQLAVTTLLRTIDDWLDHRRATIRDRRDTLVAAMADHLPEWSFTTPAGGLALWCDIGAPVSSTLVTVAERHGLRLAAGPRFGLDGAFEQRLRVPFTYPTDVLRRAVEQLARAFRATTAGAPPDRGVDAFF